jgi:hypothetical protein
LGAKAVKAVKAKRSGYGLEMQTFKGASGRSYIVFKTREGGFHTFVETEAKDAARDCGGEQQGNTRQQWQSLWKVPPK